MASAPSVKAAIPAGQRRLVYGLSLATFLLWIGGSAMLPLLPSYLAGNGLSAALIGVVMAAYFAASVFSQYPAGRLSDRVGRRPVLFSGLLIFSLGSFGFALTSGALGAICFRGLQGIGAGAFTVAAAATIGASVRMSERGRAFGALYGSQMLALAVGPLVGSSIGSSSIRLLFVIGAAIALLAALPVLSFGQQIDSRADEPGAEPALLDRRSEELEAMSGAAPFALPARRGRLSFGASGALTGALALFAASGLIAGVYESCWTLLLRLRSASDFDIGLSWTLFALPFALLSVPAGRLAERFDRRKLAIGALGSTALFAAYYPFIHSVRILVALGLFEAAGAVVGSPAALLILTEAVPSQAQGEAQGAIETARTAATALGAAGGGALFALGPVLPFLVGAALVGLSLVLIGVSWRSVPARLALRAGLQSNGAGAP